MEYFFPMSSILLVKDEALTERILEHKHTSQLRDSLKPFLLVHTHHQPKVKQDIVTAQNDSNENMIK